MKQISTLRDIDTSIPEGRLLMAAISRLTILERKITPDKEIAILNELAADIYRDKHNIKNPEGPKFTWNDLKKIVNGMSQEKLTKAIIGWPEGDEGGISITGVNELDEDHVFDGDEHSIPKSIAEKDEYDPEINYVIHEKGDFLLWYI